MYYAMRASAQSLHRESVSLHRESTDSLIIFGETVRKGKSNNKSCSVRIQN